MNVNKIVCSDKNCTAPDTPGITLCALGLISVRGFGVMCHKYIHTKCSVKYRLQIAPGDDYMVGYEGDLHFCSSDHLQKFCLLKDNVKNKF